MTDPILPYEPVEPTDVTVPVESVPSGVAPASAGAEVPTRASRRGGTAGRSRSLLAWLLALVLVAGIAAWFAFGAPRRGNATYVTATAATGDVTQSFNVSGTVARTNQVAAAFGASGLVNAVKVHVGDSVSAGQTLATLDPISLNQAVLQAKAQVAQALATLDSAENPVSTTPTTTATAATTAAATGPSLQEAQGALQAALAASQRALAAAQTAATAEATACAPVFAYLVPTPSASPSATASPTVSASTTTTATATPTATATATATASASASSTASASVPTSADVLACQSALAAVTKAQSGAEAALAAVSAAQLNVSKAIASSGSSAARTSAVATASPTVDAAKVAQAEAQVLQARQGLATAQANVEAGTLTAPVDGRVAAVSMTTGQASSSSSVTIIGSGSAQIAVEVPLVTRPMLTVGMNVVVNASGSTKTLAGQITTIKALETSGTTGAPTYTTTVVVDDPDLLLAPGSKADVSIPVKTASNVLTVPVSAVTPVTSTTGTVKVLKAGSTAPESVTVMLGAVGGGKVEISSGLTAGAIVVLADRTASIPANANVQRQGSTTTSSTAASARASSSAAAPQPTASK